MKNRNFVGKTWRKPFLQKMWRKENTNTCLGENLGFFVQNVPRNKTHTKIKHGFCGKYPGQHEYLQSREPTIFRAPPRDSHDLNRAPDQGLGEMMSPQLGPCGKYPPVESRSIPVGSPADCAKTSPVLPGSKASTSVQMAMDTLKVSCLRME